MPRNPKGAALKKEKEDKPSLRIVNGVVWTEEILDRVYQVISNPESKESLPTAALNSQRKYFYIDEEKRLRFQNGQYDLYVIPAANVKDTLELLYKDPKYAAIGRDAFYSIVSSHYIGISRRYVQQFLSRLSSVGQKSDAENIIKVGDHVRISKWTNEVYIIVKALKLKNYSDFKDFRVYLLKNAKTGI
jgi:hypothetical protein